MKYAHGNAPVLLDLCCGLGGAAMGYYRAGFDVVGVDLKPQPHYPFTFMQGDVLDVMALHLDTGLIETVSAIHASPPCQRYSALLKGRSHAARRAEHADLIAPVRTLLKASGLPYVIENVPGSPLENPVTLCGSMFGLGSGERQLRRHRLFEASFTIAVPPCNHSGKTIGVYGHGRWDNAGSKHRGGYQGNAAECAEAMGIDWGNRDGVVQAIPPAYTEWIGGQLLAELRLAAAA